MRTRSLSVHKRGRSATRSTPRTAKVRRKLFSSRSSSRSNTDEMIHDQLVRRFARVKMGPRKKKTKRLNKGCYKVIDQGNLGVTAVEGRQGSNSFAVATASQLIVSSGAAYNPAFSAYTSLFDSNPNQTITGGTLYNTPTIAPLDDRVHIDKIRLKIEIGNFQSTAVHVEMYVVVPKVNTEYDPVTEWNRCLQSQALGKPAAVQMTAATTYTPGYPTADFLDERPDYLPAWRKVWRIKQKKQFDLAGGANVIQTLMLDYNGKSIDRKYITDAYQDGQDLYIKDITSVIFFIVRGVVIDDTTNTSADNALTFPFSISSCKVGIVYSREVLAHMTTVSRVQSEYYIPRLVAGNPIASQGEINVIDQFASVVQA